MVKWPFYFLLLLEQVRTFYKKVLNEEERKRLCENIAGHLKDAQLFIQKKAVSPSLIAEGCHLLAHRDSAAVWENLTRKSLVSVLPELR